MPTNVEESVQLIIDTSTLSTVSSPYLHRVMPNITQKFIRMRKSQRPIELLNIIKKDMERNRPVIVFSNKKSTSDFVSIFLSDHDIDSVSMNKSLIEKIRRQQFKKFQSGQVNVLSTTDLASRGLDTKRVSNNSYYCMWKCIEILCIYRHVTLSILNFRNTFPTTSTDVDGLAVILAQPTVKSPIWSVECKNCN